MKPVNYTASFIWITRELSRFASIQWAVSKPAGLQTLLGARHGFRICVWYNRSSGRTISSDWKGPIEVQFVTINIPLSGLLYLTHWISTKSKFLSSEKLYRNFIVVLCCMLFQSLLYCSNSCTSLHFKTLKSHTKTLNFLAQEF